MITLGSFNEVSGLRHGFFTRAGGVSEGLYASKNCGFGSRDARENVARNRTICLEQMDSPAAVLITAYQVHSSTVATVTEAWAPDEAPEADAMVTNRPGIALGVLAADCAPVLLADPKAGVVGAAHAGWKGALSGVVEATIDAMAALGARRDRLMAGIGPRIALRSYEVGPEFKNRFIADDAGNGVHFSPAPAGDRQFFDLGAYVAARLLAAGVEDVALAPNDTMREETRFFSYRRARLRGEPDYGRNLSAIVITD